MSAIYDAISDLMDSCVKELRKSNKIDTSELTLEQGLFKSFDDIVRRQLDSVWNTVSPKTKQVSFPAMMVFATLSMQAKFAYAEWLNWTLLMTICASSPIHAAQFEMKWSNTSCA